VRRGTDVLKALALGADAVLVGRPIFHGLSSAGAEGVRRMLVNHPNFVIEASYDDARHWAELGALIEHSLCMYDEESTFYHWDLDTLVKWIEAVGAERSTLGSDLGQDGNPLPTEAFRKIVDSLLDRGMPERDVRRMVADNPRRLLDGE